MWIIQANHPGHGNAYSLDIDSYWSSMDAVDGDGVQLTNLTFKNWKGTEEDGAQRGPVKVQCPDAVPCTDITIQDFAMWTESGDEQIYTCRSAYGSGLCLESDSDDESSYSSAATATATPSAYAAPRMPNDLSTAFGTDSAIPIPTIPTSFFPGATPYSALAGAASSGVMSSATSSIAARGFMPKETGFAYPNFHGKSRRMVRGAARRFPYGYFD